MRRFPVVLLTALMLALVLSGCGDDSSDAEGSLSEDVKIIAMEGSAGDEVISELGSGYESKTYADAEKFTKAVDDGKMDAAVCTSTEAGWFYDETKRGVAEVSPVSMGGVYVLGNGYSTSMTPKSLAGEKIMTLGEGGVAENAMIKAMQESGVSESRITLKTEWKVEDLIDEMKEDGTLCVVTEPYASRIVEETDAKKIIDLDEEYEEEEGERVITDVLIISDDMLKNRPDDVKILIADFDEAVTEAKDKGSKADLVFYAKSNRGIRLLKDFNEAMVDFDDNAMGGKSLKSDFYYSVE